MVDFESRKIISRPPEKQIDEEGNTKPSSFYKNLGKSDPINWYKESKYSIDKFSEDAPEAHEDVLVKLLKDKECRRIIGNKCLDELIPLKAFNNDIYEVYEHKNLARIYIPIIHRTKINQDNSSDKLPDLEIGVIEAGYKMYKIFRWIPPLGNWYYGRKLNPELFYCSSMQIILHNLILGHILKKKVNAWLKMKFLNL